MPTIETPYGIGDQVRIKSSGEAGTVRGISVYAGVEEPSISIHYKAADGRAVEAWFSADLVEPARKPAARKR